MSNSQSVDQFPTRLRDTRKKRDLEQAELSKISGIPATSISHFEAGRRKPNLVNLRHLADALQVSIDYLLGRTENPEAHMNSAAFRDEHLISNKDRELLKEIEVLLADRTKK